MMTERTQLIGVGAVARRRTVDRPGGRMLAVFGLLVAMVLVVVLPTMAAAQQGPGPKPDAPPGCTVKLVHTRSGQQWQIVCNTPGDGEGGGGGGGGGEAPEYPPGTVFGYTASITTDADGERCYAIITHVLPPGTVDHHYYDDPEDLVRLVEALVPGTPPCPGAVVPPPDPEQLAVLEWEGLAAGLAPNVVLDPADRSVVGLPTFVMVQDYQPAGDIDGNARTVTWNFDLFQLRATSTHKVAWADGDPDNEFAYEPTWQATNGRGYLPGDEDGPTGWSGGQPNWQGSPALAWIYQEDGTRQVTVNAQWSGEWRVPGGTWADLPAPNLFVSSTVPIDVAQYQAVQTE